MPQRARHRCRQGGGCGSDCEATRTGEAPARFARSQPFSGSGTGDNSTTGAPPNRGSAAMPAVAAAARTTGRRRGDSRSTSSGHPPASSRTARSQASRRQSQREPFSWNLPWRFHVPPRDNLIEPVSVGKYTFVQLAFCERYGFAGAAAAGRHPGEGRACADRTEWYNGGVIVSAVRAAIASRHDCGVAAWVTACRRCRDTASARL